MAKATEAQSWSKAGSLLKTEIEQLRGYIETTLKEYEKEEKTPSDPRYISPNKKLAHDVKSLARDIDYVAMEAKNAARELEGDGFLCRNNFEMDFVQETLRDNVPYISDTLKSIAIAAAEHKCGNLHEKYDTYKSVEENDFLPGTLVECYNPMHEYCQTSDEINMQMALEKTLYKCKKIMDENGINKKPNSDVPIFNATFAEESVRTPEIDLAEEEKKLLSIEKFLEHYCKTHQGWLPEYDGMAVETERSSAIRNDVNLIISAWKCQLDQFKNSNETDVVLKEMQKKQYRLHRMNSLLTLKANVSNDMENPVGSAYETDPKDDAKMLQEVTEYLPDCIPAKKDLAADAACLEKYGMDADELYRSALERLQAYEIYLKERIWRDKKTASGVKVKVFSPETVARYEEKRKSGKEKIKFLVDQGKKGNILRKYGYLSGPDVLTADSEDGINAVTNPFGLSYDFFAGAAEYIENHKTVLDLIGLRNAHKFFESYALLSLAEEVDGKLLPVEGADKRLSKNHDRLCELDKEYDALYEKRFDEEVAKENYMAAYEGLSEKEQKDPCLKGLFTLLEMEKKGAFKKVTEK